MIMINIKERGGQKEGKQKVRIYKYRKGVNRETIVTEKAVCS